VVLADSRQIPGVHRYSGISTGRPAVFAYRTLTVYGRLSHTIRLTTSFITPRETVRPPTRNPTTPHTQPLTSIPRTRFRLLRFRSPLLTESHLFSLPTGTEMFHFPAFPPTPYEFEMQVTRHDSRRVTPFGHPGITARLTAPPGLSRPPTSFIGPWYQGIHRPPLPTYPHTQHTHTNRRTTNTKMLASTMQISTHHQPTTTKPPTRAAHDSAWHQDNNPTHRRNHPPARSRTRPSGRIPTPHGRWLVVPSEPQQGAHRVPPPETTGRRSPPPPARTADPQPARQHGRHGRTRRRPPAGNTLRQCLPPSRPRDTPGDPRSAKDRTP
jgi:hypothetical protein